jgi:histone-lysine N-methyltransferase SETMAR
MSVGEDPRPGRPFTSANGDHVDRVRVVSRGKCRLTLRDITDEMGISIRPCHQIFTEKLHMRRASAKFVPRFLADDQKENRLEISQALLANANGNENFLKHIRTGDETWVYMYDVETKT